MADGSKLDDKSLATGTVIGDKYSVVHKLGAGGMGAVYEAVNTWTARRVAVKVLLPSASARPDLEQRFMQEAQASSRLRHPNIIDVLDMGRDPKTGALYIVQEYLDGIDLFDHLAVHGPFLAREAMEIMVPVMGALIAAHERGVLHRDIKPENIFLAKGKGSERVPKLIDFGVAKLLSGARARGQTDSGQVVGTIHYMSPEQARAETNLDGRSDVWAVGVVLYEMLTGDLPFEADNATTLVSKLMTGTPTPIEDLAPDLPDSICAIVHKALAVDIDKRFQSVREMLDAVVASEIYCNDPPERSLLTRHMRSLPTYSAQLRPADADLPGMAVVLPRPPKPMSAVSFGGVDKMAEQAFRAMGLETTDPGPKVEVLPRAIAPTQEGASVDVLSSPPKSYPGRKRTRWTDRQRAIRGSQRLVKFAAVGFVLVSAASVLLVWHALQTIGGTRSQMNTALHQMNSAMRTQQASPSARTEVRVEDPAIEAAPPTERPETVSPSRPLGSPQSTHGRGSRGSRLPSSASPGSDGSPRS